MKEKLRSDFDKLIGGLMIALLFVLFGAYSHFTIPMAVSGAAYIFIQKRLNGRPAALTVFLRVFAVMWFAAVFCIVFGLGLDTPERYPLRKSLYVAGNYSNSKVLGFFPDEIPECEDFRERFGCPMAGQDAYGYANISFTTDAEGIEYIRQQAEAHGGEHYLYPGEDERDEADKELLKRLDLYVDYPALYEKDESITVTELYIFPEVRTHNRSCYLINPETGQVVLNW